MEDFAIYINSKELDETEIKLSYELLNYCIDNNINYKEWRKYCNYISEKVFGWFGKSYEGINEVHAKNFLDLLYSCENGILIDFDIIALGILYYLRYCKQ